MEHDTHNILTFWTIFCPFTPKQPKSEKKPGDIIILHMCTINQNHMMYASWNIEPDRHITFCHFEPFFALLPHYQFEKSKFWKNENNAWRYHHHIMITCYTVPEIWRLTNVIFIFHFGLFFALLPKAQKIKI